MHSGGGRTDDEQVSEREASLASKGDALTPSAKQTAAYQGAYQRTESNLPEGRRMMVASRGRTGGRALAKVQFKT